MSHAMAHHAGIGAGGLWSVSRGLARGLQDGLPGRDEYREMMQLADRVRQGDRDGRGNLSLAALVTFTKWFLAVCEDQVSFMAGMFDFDRMGERLTRYAALSGLGERAGDLLRIILLRGEVDRGDVAALLGVAPRTARATMKSLLDDGVVGSENPARRLDAALSQQDTRRPVSTPLRRDLRGRDEGPAFLSVFVPDFGSESSRRVGCPMTGQGWERGFRRPSRRDCYEQRGGSGTRRPVRIGGYKVDVSRGERNGRVCLNGSTGRMTSGICRSTSLASVKGRSERSRTRVVETSTSASRHRATTPSGCSWSCRRRTSRWRRRTGPLASSRALSARRRLTCGSCPRRWQGSTCSMASRITARSR